MVVGTTHKSQAVPAHEGRLHASAEPSPLHAPPGIRRLRLKGAPILHHLHQPKSLT